MERKQAFLGILIILLVAVVCTSWPGTAVPVVAQTTSDDGLGQLPTDKRDSGTRDPKYPGPLEADPDWFGTNSYDRIPIIEVQGSSRPSGWILFGAYSGVLDWLFRQVTDPTVIAIR